MEESGSRHGDLKRSFHIAAQSLLTTCDKQEFCNAFSRFTQAEKERLHQLYIQIIVSLHQNVEDHFEDLCEDTKVENILDTVDELVDEQSLDPLYPHKTNLNDVAQDLSTLKKNEIQNLTAMLEKEFEKTLKDHDKVTTDLKAIREPMMKQKEPMICNKKSS